ncbi:hypothetical protein Misp01_81740 [Microtetraspora sp. NBRC 13810]|nr:hypothetical protein Misp01_81740 [Microtetraspora sp. NBRC 13810]
MTAAGDLHVLQVEKGHAVHLFRRNVHKSAAEQAETAVLMGRAGEEAERAATTVTAAVTAVRSLEALKVEKGH